MIIHKIVPILGLVIGMPILSQEVPKANFSVCDKIKHLDPQASAEVYAAFVKKMQKGGVDSCACGMYLLNKKFDKAHEQMASENQLSKEDLELIKTAELAYANRPSASEVTIGVNDAVNSELSQHIVNTVQEFQQIRKKEYAPSYSNLSSDEPEELHVYIKGPECTLSGDVHMEAEIETDGYKKTSLNVIGLGHANASTMEELKGTFNHEFAHYFFADPAMCLFLNLGFNNGRHIKELIQPKNSIQKYFFAREYRADWFVGLMSREANNLEHSKQSLQRFTSGRYSHLHFSNDKHPPLQKRVDWLSRWINLKRAESKA